MSHWCPDCGEWYECPEDTDKTLWCDHCDTDDGSEDEDEDEDDDEAGGDLYDDDEED